MKKVLLALALFTVTGCTDKNKVVDTEAPFEPKFLYNQEVTFKHGFLKGQKGNVIAATKCVADGQGTYATDTMCYSIVIINEMHSLMTWYNVAERDLLD